MTGLSREAAQFQARSAFTGTGFTTSETEKVVNHPVRRRIIMGLMMLRSAGVVTILLSMILSFANADTEADRVTRLAFLILGAGALLLLGKSHWFGRYLSRVIQRALNRWTDLDVRDYAGLLKLSGDYSVMEVHLREGDWLVGRELGECDLFAEGVTVLGIYRNDGDYVGVPKSSTKIYADETLVLYGRAETLRELDLRRDDADGERAHQAAVQSQSHHMAEQDRNEEARETIRESTDKENDHVNTSG